MSFPKSRRFEDIKNVAPAPGAYDPKDLKHTPGAAMEKSLRFSEFKDNKDNTKYGSDSALEISGVAGTPTKNLFRTPLPQVKHVKKEKKREDFIDPSRLKELEKELKSLANERVTLDKRLANREEDVTRLEARLQDAHKEKSKLTARVATLERQMTSITKSNETLKQKMSSTDGFQSKQKALNQEFSQVQADLDKRTKETKILREQLEKTKKQGTADLKAADETLSRLQKEHTTLVDDRSKALDEIATLKKTIEELTEQKLKLEKDLAEAKSALEELKVNHEGQIADLRKSLEGKVESLTEQNTTLNNNIEALTTKYQALELNFASDQKDHELVYTQMRREASALKLSLAELQESNDQLSSVNAELLDRLSLEKDEVTILEKKLAEAECVSNDKFELLTTYLDSKSAEIDSLKQQLHLKQAEITQISADLEAAKRAAKMEIAAIKDFSQSGIGKMKESLEQKSLEEQDLRWRLERSLKQIVEYQELAELRHEELLTMQAQRDEGERETNEEMDIIHQKMEETQAKHKADLDYYRECIAELKKGVEQEKATIKIEQEARESGMNERIRNLATEMAAAEKAALDEIEQIKRKAKETESRYQEQIKSLQTDMAGCEMAAEKELAKVKEEKEEAEQYADSEIQNLVSRLSEMRLQTNEVIEELKEQLKEAKEEHAILEESSRRASEAHKTTVLQKDQDLLLCKTELESVRLELDTERADNACTVQRLDEDREKDQETIEKGNARIQDLELQLQEAEGLLGAQVTNVEEALKTSTLQIEELRMQVERGDVVANESDQRARAEVEEMRSEMARAEEVARQQLQQFDEQLKSLQNEARQEVDDLNKHLEDARTEADTEITSLRKQVKLRDEEISRLQSRLSDAEQVATSVKDSCGALKEELTRLTKDHNSAVGRAEAKFRRLLDAQKEEHEEELARKNSEDGAQHHVDMQEMSRAFQELQAEHEALKQLVGPFQDQLQAFEAERLMLLGGKTNAELEINKLSEEYAKLLGHQNQKQKIKHVLKLKQENNSLKQDLSKAREESLKLKRQVTKLEDRQRTSEAGRKFDPTKAFAHAKENQTPPVSPLRPGNRI